MPNEEFDEEKHPEEEEEEPGEEEEPEEEEKPEEKEEPDEEEDHQDCRRRTDSVGSTINVIHRWKQLISLLLASHVFRILWLVVVVDISVAEVV